MTAREQFKKIGFICVKENKRKIVYQAKHYKKIIVNKLTGSTHIISRFLIINSFPSNLTKAEFLALKTLLIELGFVEGSEE